MYPDAASRIHGASSERERDRERKREKAVQGEYRGAVRGRRRKNGKVEERGCWFSAIRIYRDGNGPAQYRSPETAAAGLRRGLVRLNYRKATKCQH